MGQCVFWEIDQSQRKWLTRGCVRVDRESNASSTTCECDHLTIFSVLFNNKPALCTITATFLHYFLLCVFSWMLCHGVILYFLIIKVETRETLVPRMKWLYAFGWGFPLPIVAISLIATGTKLNTANNCWLTPEHGVIYWAFAAPVATVIIINSILLIFLLRQINRATKFKTSMSRARPCAKRVKAWLRRTAMLLPVLGVTWLFGFLTFITSTAVFHYLFTILNSLQGFFIFVTFCILDDAVRETLVGRLSKWNAISPKEQSGLNSRITVLKITATRIQSVQSATMTATNQHGGTCNLANDARESKISEPKLQTWIAADV
ncbi:putative G-protein coupled receptor 133 [Stylophora pistillata]|uniref:Putative G-protein coupled receptor 133 n=1 Tax=Stylophora pistillata TaxID=50429 RepID=A0A2B4RHN8_STYPI|nr:putative G-protein coupled receptor 133 [Stylophora pistillata]